VKRVLLTGMSGTGKSTVIDALADRGYKAIDSDYGGLSITVDVPDEELTGLGPGKDWIWHEERIQELLSTKDTDVLFVSGCAPNQGQFYPQFDHIILLTAPAEVLAKRLATRTNNPYGKDPEERTRALQLKRTVEPLLRASAGNVIDTSAPLDDVIEIVLRCAGLSG